MPQFMGAPGPIFNPFVGPHQQQMRGMNNQRRFQVPFNHKGGMRGSSVMSHTVQPQFARGGGYQRAGAGHGGYSRGGRGRTNSSSTSSASGRESDTAKEEGEEVTQENENTESTEKQEKNSIPEDQGVEVESLSKSTDVNEAEEREESPKLTAAPENQDQEEEQPKNLRSGQVGHITSSVY